MTTNPITNPSKPNLAEIRQPVLKVIGLGGGGCNAISRMMELGMRGIEFIAANTDHQVLKTNPAPVKIQLGPKVTRGLGAGGDPRIGQAAAEESSRELAAAMSGADMVFLTAGMGGGTGTGAIPVAAEIARSIGAVTIAVVTTPFSFEMGRRQKNASEGLSRLRQQTHTLIAIPNDRLLYVAPRNLPMEVAFRLADDVLRQSVQAITELITEPGMINVDFAHISRLIRLGGGALMAIGQGHGESKARSAVEQALNHPLLESVSLENAAGIIANFTGGQDLALLEVEEALTYLQNQTGDKTEIVLGVINDDAMLGRAQVILVITGLGATTLEEALSNIRRTDITRMPEPVRKPEPVKRPEPAPEVAPPVVSSVAQPDLAVASQNLDLPAFLRRRTRMNGLSAH
jgi:cell division protein FtsZ